MSEQTPKAKWYPSQGAALLTCSVLAGILLLSGHLDYPNLHTGLDISMFLLSGMLTLLFWDISIRLNQLFPKLVAISFGATSLLEFVHAFVGVDWSGPLASIVRLSEMLRPATWPPSAHLLPLGIGGALWLFQRRGKPVLAFVVAVILLSLGLLWLFGQLPRYTAPVWLGITRPTLLAVPLLWLLTGLACWRWRSADRFLPALAQMAAVLLLGSITMLYSRAPHDTEAMVAHLGKVCGYLVMLLSLMRMAATDMSLEKSFRELNELKSALDEHAIVAITDAAGKITFVNDKFCAISGYSRSELIGQDHRIINSGHHAKEFIRNIWTTIGHGRVWRGEIKNKAKNGTFYWVDTTIVPFLNDEGKPSQYVAIRADITARKQTEEALRESEELFSTAFRNSPDCMLISRLAEGTVVRANDALARLWGSTPVELVGRPSKDHVVWREAAERQEFLRRLQEHGECLDWPAVLQMAGGREAEFNISSRLITLQGEKCVLTVLRDITERRRLEAATAAISALVEFSDDAIVGKTVGSIVTSWNRSAERIFGYTAGEMIGRPITLLIPPDRLDEEAGIMARIARGEHVRHFETIRRTKDGRLVDIAVTVSPIKDPKGQVVGASKIARDITEQKKAERALRATRARLQSTLAAGAIGTWTWEIGSDRLVADEFTARAFSVDVAGAAGGLPVATYLRAVDEEDQPRISAALARAIETCGNYDVEYRVPQPDGTRLWLQARGRVEGDGAGKAVNFHGAVMDITARKQAEAATRASEARYRTLFEYAPDGIVIADAESYYLDANARMCQMLGYTREEFIGLHASDIVVPAEIPHIGSTLSELRAKSDHQREWQFRRRDGSTFPADVIATRMPDGNLMGMIRDITERKRAEREIRESEEHFRFLNDLGEATRKLADPAQIMAIVARMLGQYLRVSRCAYADMEPDAEQFVIVHDYTDGCASTVGRYQLSLFGPRAVATLHRGQTLVIRDVAAELAPGEGGEMFQAIGIQAIITCPLVKEGRLRALMAVHQTVPRDWTPKEIAIVEDVVERCWSTLERRLAEEKIRRLNVELEQRVIARTAELETANAGLQSSRAELRSLFESLPGLYLVLTPDLQVVSASDAYLKATLTTREGIVGRNLFEIFPDNPADPGANAVVNMRASIDRVLKHAMPDTMAIQKHDVRRPDGVFEERYWSPVNSPMFGANQEIKYVIHRVEEVTDFVRHRAQAGDKGAEHNARVQQMEAEVFQGSLKLQAANRQLEDANKELEAFSYSVSHDLRAPLRAVDGYSLAVIEDFGPQLPPEGRRQLLTIRESAQRMGELIDDLLTFSRLSRQALAKRTVNTAALVQSALEDLKPALAGRQVELKLAGLPACEGDAALLKQVWINLLSNALKYSRNRTPAIVEIGCESRGGVDVFFVRDNGSGFDMRYAGKLFNVFQRLHRAEDYEGTGVGLAIVHRIVQRHGGRVWAEAAVDRGATFYFTLTGDPKA